MEVVASTRAGLGSCAANQHGSRVRPMRSGSPPVAGRGRRGPGAGGEVVVVKGLNSSGRSRSGVISRLGEFPGARGLSVLESRYNRQVRVKGSRRVAPAARLLLPGPPAAVGGGSDTRPRWPRPAVPTRPTSLRTLYLPESRLRARHTPSRAAEAVFF